MDGFVTVRIPAGAVVQLRAADLRAMECAVRGVGDEPAPVVAESIAEGPGVVPARPLPRPLELSDGEKGALRDWFRRRGVRPKYITKRRIAEYVEVTGDSGLEHLFDEAAPEDEAAPGLARLVARGLGTGVLDPLTLVKLVGEYSTDGDLSGVPEEDEPKLYRDIQDAIGEA